jgi:hypothetical protein
LASGDKDANFKGLSEVAEQAALLYGDDAVLNQLAAQSEMFAGAENSKEYIEFNFQVKYTDDENQPVKAELDIPVGEKD